MSLPFLARDGFRKDNQLIPQQVNIARLDANASSCEFRGARSQSHSPGWSLPVPSTSGSPKGDPPHPYAGQPQIRSSNARAPSAGIAAPSGQTREACYALLQSPYPYAHLSRRIDVGPHYTIPSTYTISISMCTARIQMHPHYGMPYLNITGFQHNYRLWPTFREHFGLGVDCRTGGGRSLVPEQNCRCRITLASAVC